MPAVLRQRIALRRKSADVWTGGAGDCLLLLHGAGGGAAAYWSGVWERLAERFFVVAPELPGIAGAGEPLLPTFGVYGLWLDELLDALGITRAWVVGNSLGAAVGWRFAAQAPHRCRGLVMVNGSPPAAFSMILAILLRRTPLRRLVRLRLKQLAQGPRALRAAFPDPRRVPAEIAARLAEPHPQAIDAMLDLLLSGEAPCHVPRLPSLVLWGAADRSPRCDVARARALAASLGAGEPVLLPGAGHLPQCDAPEEFTACLSRFAAAQAGGSSAA
jgi:pimeloyl-ACP methyl ester carboxylesterase